MWTYIFIDRRVKFVDKKYTYKGILCYNFYDSAFLCHNHWFHLIIFPWFSVLIWFEINYHRHDDIRQVAVDCESRNWNNITFKVWLLLWLASNLFTWVFITDLNFTSSTYPNIIEVIITADRNRLEDKLIYEVLWHSVNRTFVRLSSLINNSSALFGVKWHGLRIKMTNHTI